MGGGSDLDQITACAGLAAREVNLQDAETGGLTEHPRPGLGVEFVRPRFQRQRVGAVRATQRATVRQLGQQAKRLMQRCTSSRHLFARCRLIFARVPLFYEVFGAHRRHKAARD